MGVGPQAGPQQIRAWGPGLEGGIVGKPATFVVESIGTDVGVLGQSKQKHLILKSKIMLSFHLLLSDLLFLQVLLLRALPKLKLSVRTRMMDHVMSVTGQQKLVNTPSTSPVMKRTLNTAHSWPIFSLTTTPTTQKRSMREKRPPDCPT